MPIAVAYRFPFRFRSASSETSRLDDSSAQSHCFVTSSARSSPHGSSPTGGGSIEEIAVVSVLFFASGGVAVLYDRRRLRDHHIITPASRATTGIVIPIAILVPSLRPPFLVFFWVTEGGKGVGVELDGAVLAVEAVELVGEVEADTVVVVWPLDRGDEMVVDRDFVETRKLE